MKQLMVKGGDLVTRHSAENTTLPVYLRRRWFELLDALVFRGDGNARELILVGERGVEGTLPVYRERRRCSNRLYSLTNFYSPIFQLVSNSKPSALAYENFVDGFSRYFRCFDLVDFVPLCEVDAGHICRAFDRIRFKGFNYAHSVNWYEDNIRGFDEYWAARPAKLRSTVKRKEAKLKRLDNFAIIAGKPESKGLLWKYLGDFHHVYSASWKRAEPVPVFIDTVAEHAWESGELLVGVAYHGRIPIAAQLWFVTTDTASIYKLSYRREYASYSVGSVLSKHMFEAAIEKEGVTCIDYLTGDDAYKRDWMTKCRRLVGVRLCNLDTMTGKAHFIGNRASTAAKSVLRL